MKRYFFIYYLSALMLLLSPRYSYSLDDQKIGYDAVYGENGPAFTVATGSPGDLGLLKALAEPFCVANHCRINWLNMGSGEALKALKQGKVDMVMTHSPEAEKEAIKEGWAEKRTLLGGNEFLIVGPESDPAGVRNAKSAKEAFAMIAKRGSKFFSRGDNSGTHKKEMMIWADAGIDPSGPWYITTNDFMWPTLSRCDAEQGYFMTDSSTFFSYRSKILNLKVLLSGDPALRNIYHALAAREDRATTEIHYLVLKFIAFIGSEEGQKILRDFGRDEYGIALYMDKNTVRDYDQ